LDNGDKNQRAESDKKIEQVLGQKEKE